MRNEKIQIKAQKQDKALQTYAGLRGMCEQNKDSNRTVRINFPIERMWKESCEIICMWWGNPLYIQIFLCTGVRKEINSFDVRASQWSSLIFGSVI